MGVVNPKRTKLACILEADDSARLRMGNSDTSITIKTILQVKEIIHYSITIWFTNLFLCLKL